ncbi:MAG: sugar ABC transporter permease [Spirochaetales bacterium]|nr:sugar ABC transporter permease [Spirochaetales bacterium]
MYGVSIAFREYNIFPGRPSPWTGFANFREVFASKEFFLVLRNTFMLNFLDLVVGFPAPIILALLLNELRSRKYKRTVQTLLYLPHFLSWVIIGGIVLQVFAPTYGIINNMLKSMGIIKESIPFLTNGPHWVATYVLVGVWQNIGWGTIIYLAAITGVSPELYEAAEMDGAKRLRKIWSITLPCISSTIVILLILSIGRIAMISFERPYIIGNTLVREYADVISTYVYRIGIKSGRFSIATAVGLFQSVISLIFLIIANFVAKRSGHKGIF